MAIHQQTVGRVLVLTLDNNATRNALDAATMAALRDLFENVAYLEPLPAAATAEQGAEAGPGGAHRPHVIVLRAAGEVFCAGAHLGEMKDLGQADYQTNLSAALDMGAMFRAVRNCPVPVVARVQGPCYGGGVGLVAACDLVVVGPAAAFAFTEVRLGILPGVIAPLVVDRLGLAVTRAAFLTGEPLDAAAALRLGLADRLAAHDDELDEELGAVVDSLLAGGPAALGQIKGLLDGIESLGYSRSAELAANFIAQARTGSEGQAALQAFIRKEPAPWSTEQAWTPPPWPGAEEESP